MKKKTRIISFFLTSIFVFYGTTLFFSTPVMAAKNCKITCSAANITSANHCKDSTKNGGYLYAEPAGITDTDCPITNLPTCGIGQSQVCCCEASIAKTSPTGVTFGQSPTAVKPKYDIPEMQVKIPGLTFGDVQCVNQPNGSFLCSISWIGDYVSAVYKYGLSVAGILAAIMLMAGGILWLVSGGDATRVSQAKSLIGGSVTGLIILLSAYVILYQINPELTQLKPLKVTSITIGDTLNASDFKFDSGIDKQVNDASPELAKFLNCMRFNLPDGIGQISSISDSYHVSNLKVCESGCTVPCVHSCGSCHYGGGLGTNKSYAVDYGDEQNEVELEKAANACGVYKGGPGYIENEDDHLHMSVSTCPRK